MDKEALVLEITRQLRAALERERTERAIKRPTWIATASFYQGEAAALGRVIDLMGKIKDE